MTDEKKAPDWINCPICGEPDMRCELHGGETLIFCVNHACRSNDETGYDKRLTQAIKDRDEARADWLEVARVVDRVHDQSMGARQPGTREEVLGAVCALKNEVQRLKDARHEFADALDEQTGGRSVSEILENEAQLQRSLQAAGKEIERLTVALDAERNWHMLVLLRCEAILSKKDGET